MNLVNKEYETKLKPNGFVNLACQLCCILPLSSSSSQIKDDVSTAASLPAGSVPFAAAPLPPHPRNSIRFDAVGVRGVATALSSTPLLLCNPYSPWRGASATASAPGTRLRPRPSRRLRSTSRSTHSPGPPTPSTRAMPSSGARSPRTTRLTSSGGSAPASPTPPPRPGTYLPILLLLLLLLLLTEGRVYLRREKARSLHDAIQKLDKYKNIVTRKRLRSESGPEKLSSGALRMGAQNSSAVMSKRVRSSLADARVRASPLFPFAQCCAYSS
jgi:hypothetical protein